MRKLFLPILLAALFLTACGGSGQTTPTIQPTRINTPGAIPLHSAKTPTTAELELTDPSQPIQVSVGSQFTITVKTHRYPTDLHWELAQALNTQIVDFVWKDYVPDDLNDPNSSGKDVWRFKAIGPGQTTITLGYYQGETVNVKQQQAYTIVVK